MYVCACVYLVMFECAVDQQRWLFLHPLYDSVGHSIIRRRAGLSSGNTVLIIHILLGWPVCMCKKKKRGGGVIMSETPLTVLFRIDFNDQFQDSVVSGAKS